MRMQQPIPQQMNQYRHGYQIGSIDQGQQQLSGASHHTSPQQYITMNQLNGQGMWVAPTMTQPQPQALGRLNCTEREFMENQKAEKMKRKLKKRGISEGNWQYYLKSPHSWDFTNISSSGL